MSGKGFTNSEVESYHGIPWCNFTNRHLLPVIGFRCADAFSDVNLRKKSMDLPHPPSLWWRARNNLYLTDQTSFEAIMKARMKTGLLRPEGCIVHGQPDRSPALSLYFCAPFKPFLLCKICCRERWRLNKLYKPFRSFISRHTASLNSAGHVRRWSITKQFGISI